MYVVFEPHNEDVTLLYFLVMIFSSYENAESLRELDFLLEKY